MCPFNYGDSLKAADYIKSKKKSHIGDYYKKGKSPVRVVDWKKDILADSVKSKPQKRENTPMEKEVDYDDLKKMDGESFMNFSRNNPRMYKRLMNKVKKMKDAENIERD